MCVFHAMLTQPDVTAEEAVIIQALRIHELLPAYMEWYADNPGGENHWVRTLESVARDRDQLLAAVLQFPEERGADALKALRVLISGESPTVGRSLPMVGVAAERSGSCCHGG